MEFKLKSISQAGIGTAIAKAERYRYLNEPEEAESICRDILAVDPNHQLAKRILGLAITDQFSGGVNDRVTEASSVFDSLEERRTTYNSGSQQYATDSTTEVASLSARGMRLARLDYEPPAKGEPLLVTPDAEKIRAAGNDEAILRWNRCVRLLEQIPMPEPREEMQSFESGDTSPQFPARTTPLRAGRSR